jgi:hypothetical protein
MVEPSPLNLVTAIADSELENFVASTLFTQGWNVNFRALDFESLLSYSKTKECKESVLVLATDLEGSTPEKLREISKNFSKVFILASTPNNPYIDAISIPKSSLELIGLLRGSLRAPMIAQTRPDKSQRRARVIAIGSAGSATGCSTLALNLATELALCEKSTLLIDANSELPALSTLLGVRGLHTEVAPRALNPFLGISEISQENLHSIIGYLETALTERDFIVIDLGGIRDLSANLSGKRWTAEALVWACTHGDDLWVLAKSDLLGLERLRSLSSALSRTAIRPEITYFQSQRPSGKAGSQSTADFSEMITRAGATSKNANLEEFLFDPRSAKASAQAQLSLADVNEKSHLRKSIAHLAARLIA